MSKEYSFSVMPSVSISRSRFVRKSQHKTSFNLGKLIPIYCDEVLPGDTRSIDMASLIRMSTPIAPIMDNIYVDFYAFFVPNRLVWSHWKEFMGENNVSAGIPSQNYTIPFYEGGSSDGSSCVANVSSYWDYFGLPTGVPIYQPGVEPHGVKVSVLPFRGLALCYNEWFRNQNIIAPLPIQTGDTNEVLVGELAAATNDDDPLFGLSISLVLNVAKFADYFTKALPYAQKGAPVSIPLGNTAPLKVIGDSYEPSGLSSGGVAEIFSGTDNSSSGSFNTDIYLKQGVSTTNLVADLSNATAATINQLRYAFQLQKLLEKDALYGSRYFEILKAHFGVISPDARLQRPEYLGGFRQRINIDQVLSTAGYDDSITTDLGKPGANSVTGSKSSLFTKSFVEHGYIFILACARHDQTYSQGINRMWSRQSRYDFYFPVFANLGAQDVKVKEIYAQGTSDDDDIFGYQEAWAEYRYKPSIASGLLNPNVHGSLDFWTLANKFSAKPTLGQVFIEQTRDNIKRALATGNSGPDFIADFYFEDIAVRPMPMYSIPGLIDHH